MSDDIVTRLRKVAPQAKAQDPQSLDPYWWSLEGLVLASADEIEHLRSLNTALAACLEGMKKEVERLQVVLNNG